jgi:hypothetical protein
MKWPDRTAQGFSPGEPHKGNPALKGRPNRFAYNTLVCRCLYTAQSFIELSSTDATFGRLKTDSLRPPFQGGFRGPLNPGLKPWAILLDHFMVPAHATRFELARGGLPFPLLDSSS